MSWERGERPEPGWTRRRFVKVGMGVAAFAAGAAATGVGAVMMETLLPPPTEPAGRILASLMYTKFPNRPVVEPQGERALEGDGLRAVAGRDRGVAGLLLR